MWHSHSTSFWIEKSRGRKSQAHFPPVNQGGSAHANTILGSQSHSWEVFFFFYLFNLSPCLWSEMKGNEVKVNLLPASQSWCKTGRLWQWWAQQLVHRACYSKLVWDWYSKSKRLFLCSELELNMLIWGLFQVFCLTPLAFNSFILHHLM